MAGSAIIIYMASLLVHVVQEHKSQAYPMSWYAGIATGSLVVLRGRAIVLERERSVLLALTPRWTRKDIPLPGGPGLQTSWGNSGKFQSLQRTDGCVRQRN